jgi:hypothetical protein
VNGRLDVTIVRHLHRDLRPLIDVQRRTGDRTVVPEHAQLGVVDSLSHRLDADVEPVPVYESDELRARSLRETRRLGGEQVIGFHGFVVDRVGRSGYGLHVPSPSISCQVVRDAIASRLAGYQAPNDVASAEADQRSPSGRPSIGAGFLLRCPPYVSTGDSNLASTAFVLAQGRQLHVFVTSFARLRVYPRTHRRQQRHQ